MTAHTPPYEFGEIREEELFKSIPQEYEGEVSPLIKRELRKSRREILVYLEDDSTGVQKSHDVYLILDHSEQGIREGIEAARKAGHRLVFILTNSRALPPKSVEELNRRIVEALTEVSEEGNIELRLGSRSDSTLRGHFPLEPLTIKKTLESRGRFVDGIVVSYAFLTEMSRITVNNVHLLRIRKDDGSFWYTPVHLTDFAQDPLFHYPTSNMAKYVEYKFKNSNLETRAEDVLHISVDDVRLGGPEEVAGKLLEAENGRVITVDIASRKDLEVFVLGLLLAEKQGKYFIYRTAASFPPARVGMEEASVLTAEQILGRRKLRGGVLCLWGSIVELSNIQLDGMLREMADWVFVGFDVRRILGNEAEREETINSARNSVEKALKQGKNVVVYTIPRDEYPPEGLDEEERAANHMKIAHSLQQICERGRLSPSVLVFKGGITSSVGLLSSGAKKVYVLGQIDSGIPIVKILPEDNTRFPGRETFMVLGPGNVGTADTYVEMMKKLLNR